MQTERIARESEHVAELSAAKDARWSHALPLLLCRRRTDRRIGVCKDPAGLVGAEFPESFADGGILRAEDGGGEERGIDRAGLADGECADRDAAGHLRNGEERIETLEGC